MLQCYYVFNILGSLKQENTVLVTSGLHPMGRAAISIALHEKCETYAVVGSDQQVDQLADLFPQVIIAIVRDTTRWRTLEGRNLQILCVRLKTAMYEVRQ